MQLPMVCGGKTRRVKMEYKAPTGSKSLFLHLLLLFLLLASSSSSTTAQSDDIGYVPGDAEAGLNDVDFTSNTITLTMERKEGSLATTTSPGNQEESVENGTLATKEGDQQPSEGNYKQCPAEFQCQCPAVCECPDSKSFNQIKDDLAPFIRQQFRELLKKALDN
ncbi:hypothetical protein LOK49_LG05G00286 [Camellia lanceoleosa]|uniref:Uncharacterized protein n=1 Tax=Camellia lanceoleosa TaxID=1840588 RepID=A0ACC0HR77_9ERIC|nr:hypothetical protein LOK49_LG05G00286 [Camellia lanceoleosa]